MTGSPGAPLAGRRVVVTRAAGQAEMLVAKLREFGAEPIVVPLIDIIEASDGGTAVEHALERLADYDWLVVTSPNGALRVRQALAAAAATAGRPKVAVVGTATEVALGTTADLVPTEQTAIGLLAEFPDGDGAVLIVVPERPGNERGLADALSDKGWRVDEVAAYRTVPVVPSTVALLEVLSADAVLFASGSAVRAWVQVFGAEMPAVAIGMGPSTAAAASSVGLKLDRVATDHSVDGLVSSLVAYFSYTDYNS